MFIASYNYKLHSFVQSLIQWNNLATHWIANIIDSEILD